MRRWGLARRVGSGSRVSPDPLSIGYILARHCTPHLEQQHGRLPRLPRRVRLSPFDLLRSEACAAGSLPALAGVATAPLSRWFRHCKTRRSDPPPVPGGGRGRRDAGRHPARANRVPAPACPTGPASGQGVDGCGASRLGNIAQELLAPAFRGTAGGWRNSKTTHTQRHARTWARWFETAVAKAGAACMAAPAQRVPTI